MADPIEIFANQIIDVDKQKIIGLSSKADAVTINEAITPGDVVNGKVTVATSGTAVALGATKVLVNGVTVKSLSANTGKIYVGNSTVTTSNGFELLAGESVFVACDNLADVYVNSNADSQNICFVGG